MVSLRAPQAPKPEGSLTSSSEGRRKWHRPRRSDKWEASPWRVVEKCEVEDSSFRSATGTRASPTRPMYSSLVKSMRPPSLAQHKLQLGTHCRLTMDQTRVSLQLLSLLLAVVSN